MGLESLLSLMVVDMKANLLMISSREKAPCAGLTAKYTQVIGY